jgi:hypothetical protein
MPRALAVIPGTSHRGSAASPGVAAVRRKQAMHPEQADSSGISLFSAPGLFSVPEGGAQPNSAAASS